MYSALDHQPQAVTPPTTNISGSHNFQNQQNQDVQQNFQRQNFQTQQNQSGNKGIRTRRCRNNHGNQENWKKIKILIITINVPRITDHKIITIFREIVTHPTKTIVQSVWPKSIERTRNTANQQQN